MISQVALGETTVALSKNAFNNTVYSGIARFKITGPRQQFEVEQPFENAASVAEGIASAAALLTADMIFVANEIDAIAKSFRE